MYKSKRSDRGPERSSSPISKRSRSSLGRYGDPDSDEGSPERGRGRSPAGPRRTDYYDTSRGYKDGHHSSAPSSRPYPYKVLCISALPGKASDDIVRDTLYREFKRFGEISVKVVHEPDERVAYVYFRSYEEAREAKHSKNRILVFDKPVMIEAAYESSTSTSSYKDSSSGYGDSRSGGGYGSGGGYRRSPHPPQPMPPIYDRGHREDHRIGGYDGRAYQGGPPHHHPPPHQAYIRPDYRRDPHDYGARAGPHGPPMYAPRYDKYPPYDYGAQRYPPGPPGGPRMPPPGPEAHLRPPYENKKDKFPNYLQHIPPEDDPLATRTLFAGNLEVSISDEEMRRIFGRYGTVEDIDIKRPPPGTGNAYAFVRFANLDMASRAKSELSGQYIGKFQCKIGYGKVNPTTKIWVGGLGPWTTLKMLEDEFDRFGVMKKIDWEKGDDQAFITYESIDAAQAAVKQMRGFALGGSEKRIRTDFAGVEQIVGYASKYNNAGGGTAGPNENENGKPTSFESTNYDNDKFRSSSTGRQGRSSNAGSGVEDDGPIVKSSSFGNRSPDLGSSPSDSESTSDRKSNKAKNGFGTFKSIMDIAKRETPGWAGSLILKNSSFPTKLFLTDGDLQSINVLMKDEDGKDKLRITQRLRLDQSKLDDVTQKIIKTEGSYGVFLAMPTSSSSSGSSPMESPNAGSSDVQSRPLRSLVSYLKEKTAAGVISLQNKAMDLTGILYAFPPCKFSLELLQKTCPNVEETKDDYLVVVVTRGT